MSEIYEKIKPIIDQNLNEENLKLFLYWIIQRYKIHLLKDVEGKPYPWTEDEILKSYSFTNVRRIQDTVTKFVLNEICLNKELTLKQKVINLIIFRIFNEPSKYKLIKLPIRQSFIKNEDFNEFLNYHIENITTDEILYRPAYMHSGAVKAHDTFAQSIPSNLRPFYIVWKCYKQNIQTIVQHILNDNRTKVFDEILSIKGIGPFLAYQIYVDLTYCPQTKLTENDFVHLGEGALRGVDIVCPKIPTTKRYLFIHFVEENLNTWLTKYYGVSLQELMCDLPQDKRYLSLSNIQNCFCEFSKYYRFKFTTTPLKRRYYKIKK